MAKKKLGYSKNLKDDEVYQKNTSEMGNRQPSSKLIFGMQFIDQTVFGILKIINILKIQSALQGNLQDLARCLPKIVGQKSGLISVIAYVTFIINQLVNMLDISINPLYPITSASFINLEQILDI